MCLCKALDYKNDIKSQHFHKYSELEHIPSEVSEGLRLFYWQHRSLLLTLQVWETSSSHSLMEFGGITVLRIKCLCFFYYCMTLVQQRVKGYLFSDKFSLDCVLCNHDTSEVPALWGLCWEVQGQQVDWRTPWQCWVQLPSAIKRETYCTAQPRATGMRGLENLGSEQRLGKPGLLCRGREGSGGISPLCRYQQERAKGTKPGSASGAQGQEQRPWLHTDTDTGPLGRQKTLCLRKMTKYHREMVESLLLKILGTHLDVAPGGPA